MQLSSGVKPVRDENVLSWNFANVVTIWLMVILLGVVMGIASHVFYRKRNGGPVRAAAKDNSGNLVAA